MKTFDVHLRSGGAFRISADTYLVDGETLVFSGNAEPPARFRDWSCVFEAEPPKPDEGDPPLPPWWKFWA